MYKFTRMKNTEIGLLLACVLVLTSIRMLETAAETGGGPCLCPNLEEKSISKDSPHTDKAGGIFCGFELNRYPFKSPQACEEQNLYRCPNKADWKVGVEAEVYQYCSLCRPYTEAEIEDDWTIRGTHVGYVRRDGRYRICGRPFGPYQK